MKLLSFITYKIFTFILKIFPKFIIKRILKALSIFIYKINKKHRLIAFANLDFAYDNKLSFKEKEEIVKGSYDNLVYNLYEFIVNQNNTLEDMDKMITMKDDHYLVEAIKNDEKIIVVAPHYGGWETMLPYIALRYNEVSIIVKNVENEYLTHIVENVRSINNVNMIDKHGAAKKILKALREKRIVGMLIDQSISTSEACIVDFFGKKVTQTDSPVRLASRLGAVIIPAFFVRDGFEKHNGYFCEPIRVSKNITEEEVLKVSQEISDLFEKQIREKPSDWFWQHKRFKEFNREIYE